MEKKKKERGTSTEGMRVRRREGQREVMRCQAENETIKERGAEKRRRGKSNRIPYQSSWQRTAFHLSKTQNLSRQLEALPSEL